MLARVVRAACTAGPIAARQFGGVAHGVPNTCKGRDMKRILVGALAGIGALVILLVVIVLAVGGLAWTRTGTVPARTILEVNFTHGFQEQTRMIR